MNKIILIGITFVSFILGMTIAFYITIFFEPCPYLAVEQRMFNYTEKDCYTKFDLELIIFGKVLDHE